MKSKNVLMLLCAIGLSACSGLSTDPSATESGNPIIRTESGAPDLMRRIQLELISEPSDWRQEVWYCVDAINFLKDGELYFTQTFSEPEIKRVSSEGASDFTSIPLNDFDFTNPSHTIVFRTALRCQRPGSNLLFATAYFLRGGPGDRNYRSFRLVPEEFTIDFASIDSNGDALYHIWANQQLDPDSNDGEVEVSEPEVMEPDALGEGFGT